MDATLKLERGRAHHSRGPQQFSCWPASVAFVVVLTSRKPLKASRWFPYVEETGGKIFRSNG